MTYAKGGYVGSYVCGQCLTTCDGVYFVGKEQKWLCGPCKSKVQPPGPERESVNPVQQLGGDPEQEGAR